MRFQRRPRRRARKDSYENYLQRLEELEKSPRVSAVWKRFIAIAAGREVRVFVTRIRL